MTLHCETSANMVKRIKMVNVVTRVTEMRYAHPPYENEPCFSRSRLKTPPRFPAAQNRAAHKAASRFFPSVGGQA